MTTKMATPRVITEVSPFVRSFFSHPSWAWFWLVARIAVSSEWLTSGWGKVSDPAWVGPNAGQALTGFFKNALSLTGGAHPSVQGWYAWFIQNIALPEVVVWSYVVAFGELLVGLGLLFGVLTGLAAFFGGFMDLNYMLAGSVSTNPILMIAAIGIALAWRIAGWWGGDRWLLPALERLRVRR
jgi:thiosulfate dehydrogenase [quinone] large subunit